MRFVIAEDLHAFADRGTDDCAFDRLMVIDGRARHGTDDRAARQACACVAIVVAKRSACSMASC